MEESQHNDQPLASDNSIFGEAEYVDYLVALSATGNENFALKPARCAFCLHILHYDLVFEDKSEDNRKFCRDALALLINSTGTEVGRSTFFSNEVYKRFVEMNFEEYGGYKCLLSYLLQFLTHQRCSLKDSICMLLSNLSRDEHSEKFVDDLKKGEKELLMIVNIFVYSTATKGNSLDHMASVLCNISNSDYIFELFMVKNPDVFKALLSQINNSGISVTRCQGIIGLVKNFCFRIDYHEQMLGREFDILSYILYPIAGNESFPEEDMEKLPVGLQYLSKHKVRVEDPLTRLWILETLLKLCTTRKSREILRTNNVYIILREYHKWETDSSNLSLTEDVVNFLIRTEEEIGIDDMRSVEVDDNTHTHTIDASKK